MTVLVLPVSLSEMTQSQRPSSAISVKILRTLPIRCSARYLNASFWVCRDGHLVHDNEVDSILLRIFVVHEVDAVSLWVKSFKVLHQNHDSSQRMTSRGLNVTETAEAPSSVLIGSRTHDNALLCSWVFSTMWSRVQLWQQFLQNSIVPQVVLAFAALEMEDMREISIHGATLRHLAPVHGFDLTIILIMTRHSIWSSQVRCEGVKQAWLLESKEIAKKSLVEQGGYLMNAKMKFLMIWQL